MDSLLNAVGKFVAITAELEMIQHACLEAAAKEFLNKARDAMGTYEYGWPPLKPETVARKTAGDTPLVETGEMRDSGSYEIHSNYVLIGFEDPKMHFHEFGTSHVPPRPVIGGTIDHHGQEIADQMGVHFGEIFTDTLFGRPISSAIARVLHRL